MQQILLFGAGKSATSLIRYLVTLAETRNWQLVVVDTNLSLAQSKIGSSSRALAVSIDVANEQERQSLVEAASIVISLLPPALHHLVARSCVSAGKHLLTASYLDDPIRSLEPAIREKGLLFLCEMGLDPGIDHMSAMQLISRIKQDAGRIRSFRSHTGGLVAPDSDNNPWHYKISWNPRNVVLAGSAGAHYKEEGQIVTRAYKELFVSPETTAVDSIGKLAWYPNRDSLSYIPIYQLEEAATFIRTTLRYPSFTRAWDSIVQAGLTDDHTPLPSATSTFAEWSAPILPYVRDDNRIQLEFLGLFDKTTVPSGDRTGVRAKTSADILQYLLETRLAMHPGDKDMIVMQHEIQYERSGSGLRDVRSTLVVKGDDHLQTAMAKTVGLPLGIAARLILEGKIRLTGLHIPILPEIYTPVLQELEEQGIRFVETED